MTSLDLSGTNVLAHFAYDSLVNSQLSFGTLVIVGGLLAGRANLLVHLSGSQKRALVIEALLHALEKIGLEKSLDLTDSVRFVNETLPWVLNLAVSASRGNPDLSKKKSSCWSYLSAFDCRSLNQVETPLPIPVMDSQEVKIVDTCQSLMTNKVSLALPPVQEEEDLALIHPANTAPEPNLVQPLQEVPKEDP